MIEQFYFVWLDIFVIEQVVIIVRNHTVEQMVAVQPVVVSVQSILKVHITVNTVNA